MGREDREWEKARMEGEAQVFTPISTIHTAVLTFLKRSGARGCETTGQDPGNRESNERKERSCALIVIVLLAPFVSFPQHLEPHLERFPPLLPH